MSRGARFRFKLFILSRYNRDGINGKNYINKYTYMKLNIGDREYLFEIGGQLGLYYRYETVFGHSFGEDLNNYSPVVFYIRFSYAAMMQCNDNFDLTFEEYVKKVDDDDLLKMKDVIEAKMAYWNQISATKEEDSTEAKEKKE